VVEGTAGLQRRRRNGLGRRRFNGGGALACAQRGGGWRGVCRCANEGEREGGLGFGLKWPRAGWLRASRATWARRPRQCAARRQLRGDEGADSLGPRAEGAGKAGAGAGKAAALTGGPARAEREEGGEGARAGWAGWAERLRGAGGVGFFSFFFYSGICFPFSFYLLYLIQIQISHNSN
jgi:hypothetical protein